MVKIDEVMCYHLGVIFRLKCIKCPEYQYFYAFLH